MKHIIVDLEMNSVNKNEPGYEIFRGELIEIGAVMLDDDMQEISEFKTYVKPEYSESISPRIVELTGITDEHIKDAPLFAEAFDSFAKWCLDSGDDIKLYEWSNSDHEQLMSESKHKHTELSPEQRRVLDGTWVDIQRIFDHKAHSSRQISLNVAMYAAGLKVEGELHDALDDARNTGKILAMLNDEEQLAVALERIDAYFNPPPLTTSMGALFDFSKLLNGTE